MSTADELPDADEIAARRADLEALAKRTDPAGRWLYSKALRWSITRTRWPLPRPAPTDVP